MIPMKNCACIVCDCTNVVLKTKFTCVDCRRHHKSRKRKLQRQCVKEIKDAAVSLSNFATSSPPPPPPPLNPHLNPQEKVRFDVMRSRVNEFDVKLTKEEIAFLCRFVNLEYFLSNGDLMEGVVSIGNTQHDQRGAKEIFFPKDWIPKGTANGHVKMKAHTIGLRTLRSLADNEDYKVHWKDILTKICNLFEQSIILPPLHYDNNKK